MKAISLQLNDQVFSELEEILSDLKIARNKYINEAVQHYNTLQRRKILEKKLEEESMMVRENSMNVLRDFDGIEYGNQTV